MTEVQGRCAVCGGPFFYEIDVRTVKMRDDGQWVHIACTGCNCAGCTWRETCPGCDVELQPTSGGKKQCRRCGYLLTCCDTV